MAVYAHIGVNEMSLHLILLILIGLILTLLGAFILKKKRVAIQLQLVSRRVQNAKKFSITLGTIFVIIGIATMLSPLMTLIIGNDYWVLYGFGTIACCLLVLLFIVR